MWSSNDWHATRILLDPVGVLVKVSLFGDIVLLYNEFLTCISPSRIFSANSWGELLSCRRFVSVKRNLQK